MRICSKFDRSFVAATQSLAVLALLTACSSFGPAPYDNPSYVLDEYGMVYGAVPGLSQDESYLAPRFSAFEAGIGNSYYRADPFWPSRPISGFNARRSPYYSGSPFYAGAYRPPIYSAPSPGRAPPPSQGPAVPPGAGISSPVTPIASPVMAPPGIRVRPEPVFRRPSQRNSRFTRSDTSSPRAGSRGQPGARPPSARPPRAPASRVPPAPRPAPSRPRVIDP